MTELSDGEKLSNGIKIMQTLLDERDATIQKLSVTLDQLILRYAELEGSGVPRPKGTPELGVV